VGKSTFAARHFKPTEIVSSDRLRAIISDDENDQGVNRAAFGLLHRIVRARLALGRLTVVDATNLETSARRRLLRIARDYRTPVVAIAFDFPLEKCLKQNRARAQRGVDEDVVLRHAAQIQKARARLAVESYARIHVLNETNVDDAQIKRARH